MASRRHGSRATPRDVPSSGAGAGAGAGASHGGRSDKSKGKPRRGSNKQKPSEVPTPLGNCESVAAYDKVCRVGQGTYGTVYKARHMGTGKVVALKRVIPHHEEAYGFPVTALREISVLRSLKHPCVVGMDGVVVGRKRESIFLVFEFCENDLACIIDNVKNAFSEAQVKCILMQILEGVAYCHEHFVLHRDLKMSNILYSGRGDVKIADFGLARKFGLPVGRYTPKVVTLWYRAPELLFGGLDYGTGIDMWAVGCIMGELLKSVPVMPGKNEMDQIKLMFKLLGAPNERIWPGFSKLPLSGALAADKARYQHSRLHQAFPKLSDQGLDLLSKLLTYDPVQRISASDALAHPYFMEFPVPKERKAMPRFNEGVARGSVGGGRRRLPRPPSAELKHAVGLMGGPDEFSPSTIARPSAVPSLYSRVGSVFGGAGGSGAASTSLISALAVDDTVSIGGGAAPDSSITALEESSIVMPTASAAESGRSSKRMRLA